MTDHSVTPQVNPTNAKLLATNAALQTKNQHMAELAAMQNNGEEKNDKKKVNDNLHEEHQSDSNKYGHTTDKCVVAKDFLERLARQGLLDKYVTSRGQKEATRNTDKPSYTSEYKEKGTWHGPVDAPTSKGIINYISGGFAGGGATNTARKRSYWAMMTMEGSRQDTHSSALTTQIAFSISNFKSQCPNLDDPVVISICTGELMVKKVLLDPGSSANVLFYSTFRKMQLSDKALQHSTGKLVGFSGESVPVSGYVWLRTTLGEPSNSKTLDIQFLVIDCSSPYNIILECLSLNSFGAIVSTVHFCVKFPVQDNMVAIVYADHKEA
ncbi:uncharacterized protein LOC107647360 [Arachis ipaensis]|uniref:uncharacterized protein LOC107647360 n=1 Tax=Arachis ipaensis TaxID=130454 RepID=UPI0007AFB3D0|nr:uncharacterized protein LOC107647360 [Arachis ipaensis]XP_025661850.1 uncharacterized protein LOC112757489 [Arachis hypogaea]